MKLKKAGQLEQALAEFQKAFTVDPRFGHRAAGDQGNHRDLG